MYNDTAASDLIAVMALIAVFVTAAAIAGVALLSYPPGDAAPAMIARSVTENGTLYIYHDGGDPLEKEHFAILVDGGEWTENFSLVDASGIEYEPGTWTTWETGEVLVNKTPLGKGTPRIQIVGEGVGRTGSDWLLHEIGNGTPTTPTPTETTPTPTGTTPTPTETTPTPTETTPTPTETTPTPTETTPTPVSLVANFTANITAGLAPLSVQFTDTSTGEPTSWSWTFGDGNTSTVQHPIHTYAAPGIYTVSLTITKAGASATETKTGYIAVYNSSSPGLVGTYYPTREFTGTPVHRIDQRLRFADALAGEWYHCNSDEEDWPNSTLGKTEQFSVVYEGYLLVPVDAVYTFYLTSDDGSRLWIDAVGEDAEPLIDNWGYHPPTEKNSTIHLSAGSHPIKVKMFENWNAAVLYLEWSSPAFARTPVDAFCRSPPPASADFTASPTSGSAPLSVQFTDTSAGEPTSWSWDFGGGGTSTEQNPVHTYIIPGTYTVTLTAENAHGSDTVTKVGYVTVTELQPPTVTAIIPDSGESGTIVSITNLAGTDFQNGATVKLTKSGETDIHATGVTFVSSTQITCSFNLAGAVTGQWNIIVTNPDTQSGTLSNGFEVTTGQIYKPEPDLNNELNHWTKSGSIDVVTVSGHGDVVKMTETSSIKRTLSTVGYENIQVSFSLAAVGFNNPNDAVVVEWFDGTSWHELLHIKGKNPLGDEQFHDFSYSLPSSAKDNPSFEIRFGIEHQGKTESALVDLKKLEVTGDPI